VEFEGWRVELKTTITNRVFIKTVYVMSFPYCDFTQHKFQRESILSLSSKKSNLDPR